MLATAFSTRFDSCKASALLPGDFCPGNIEYGILPTQDKSRHVLLQNSLESFICLGLTLTMVTVTEAQDRMRHSMDLKPEQFWELVISVRATKSQDTVELTTEGHILVTPENSTGFCLLLP